MSLIVSILILAYVLAWFGARAKVLIGRAGKNRKAGTTGTVVQWAPEPPNWSAYISPTFLRLKGPEAQRVRDDLAEFRKDIDGAVENDWIVRRIREAIRAAA